MTPYFIQAFIYLCAAVVMVPVAKRLGLGSVLGYLIAGVIIGPVTGLVGQETVIIQHFAEFGVVMMLFLVGLELEPHALWEMRARLVGLGGLQVALTTVGVMLCAMLFGLSLTVSLTIGLVLSLSSTAIVLQTLNEKGMSKTEGGRTAFSVLLFQDIAVIPMLAIIPLLALPELVEKAAHLAAKAADHHEEMSLVAALPGWLHALVVLSVIVLLVVGGKFLSRPLFRYIASTGLREIFTATALLLVIGIAALMSLVGLSPALGTFLAGVVLANSEFRHELEAGIEPFKGLLLGLFFITVGAGIHFATLLDNLVIVIAATLSIMLFKAAVLLLLAKIFKVSDSDRWLFSLSLAQAGEFGFVLLAYAVGQDALPEDVAKLLSLVVALSMLLTPALFILFEKAIRPRFKAGDNADEPDDIDDTGPVIIAGIGRFGQIVNRLLVANNVKTVVLDHRARQIERLRKVRIKSYFGDATRPDLLRTAGIESASLFVVAIDDRERSTEVVAYVKQTFPGVEILARAYDRGHLYQLKDAGADFVVSETYFSSLEMGREALQRIGFHPFRAQQLMTAFLETEKKHSDEMFDSWKHQEEGESFTAHYRELFMKLDEMLIEVMRHDRSDRHSKAERGWTPPPKGYAEDLEK